MLGLLDSHGDHAPGRTISAQQGRVAWRYCSRWGVTPPHPRAPRRQGAPVHSSTVHHPGYNRQRCTTYVAAHPLRRAAPEQKGCNAYGSGAPPPTTSLHVVFLAGATHAGVQQAQAAQHCTRYVAMHPLRRGAPDQKGCIAYGSGAPAPTTSTTAGSSSRHTPTGNIGRSHTSSKRSPRLHTRDAAPVREHYTS